MGSIVDAARNWTDTLQTMVPGYRDRIAHIYLNPQQGGLNLNMPSKTVQEVSEYGCDAAARLADRYLRGIDNGQPTPMTWDNQRWIRYRSAMELLRDFLSRFRTSFQNPEPGDRTYAQLIERDEYTPPASYTEEQRECARDITPALADLGQELGDCDLAKNAPSPEPSLRVRPKF